MHTQGGAQGGGQGRRGQQAVQQHGFDGQPAEEAGTEGHLAHLAIAQGRRHDAGDEAARHRGQVQHGGGGGGVAPALPQPARPPHGEQQREGGAQGV
ncbi:hypothetical protein AZA_01085 [Nitrospirillum viridazoti Y2]|nr:hypothetical protein AZA_01085 [Nitrospirillum amazonense Y2]